MARTTLYPKLLSVVAAVAILLTASCTFATAASSQPTRHQLHSVLRDSQLLRRIAEEIDSNPTVAPSHPPPPPKDHHAHHHKKQPAAEPTDSNSNSGGGTANAPNRSFTFPTAGASKPIVALLFSSVGIGFIVAGIAFDRQREDEGEDTSSNDHKLRGSVKQRIARFSNLVEMRSTSANSGSRYGSKKKTINARRREQWRLFTRQQKKQQMAENDITDDDVYVRAVDIYDVGAGMVVV